MPSPAAFAEDRVTGLARVDGVNFVNFVGIGLLGADAVLALGSAPCAA